MKSAPDSTPLVIHVGREELVIKRRYEVASIANDALIALWFVTGSIMFFSERWTTAGTWCFLMRQHRATGPARDPSHPAPAPAARSLPGALVPLCGCCVQRRLTGLLNARSGSP